MMGRRTAHAGTGVVLLAALLGLAAIACAQQPQGARPVSRNDGEYASTFLIVVSLLLLGAWLLVANWVAADIRRLRVEFTIWGGLVLGGGLVGFLLLMVIPWYILGLVVALLCAGGSIAAYISFRNGRVPAEQRVTMASIRAGIRNGLARRGGQKTDEEEIDWPKRVLFLDPAGRVRVLEPPDDEQRLGYPLACRFLHEAAWRRASDVYVLPAGPQCTVRVRIDGVLSELAPIDRRDGQRIIAFLKGVAGLDVSNRRRPQSGNCRVHLLDKTIELRIRTAGTTEGERFEARLLEPGALLRLGSLGLDERMLASCRKMGELRRGLIAVIGPSGSGLTTTLYALLKEHDAFQFNIHSLEAPRLMDLDNVTQEDFDDQGATVTFARQFQSILRKDPDIVLLGQLPDAETARLAMQAVKAGKKIFAGMAADDTFEALGRLIDMADSADLVADSLVALLAQRLLRKLCANCKEAYRPPPELLAKINLQAEQFYRPTGKVVDEDGNRVDCPKCQGTGYVGRTGVFELLVMTSPLRELLRKGASAKQIKDECRRTGMLYLQENALAKVVEGATSIKEVLRTTQKRGKTPAR
jgi:type II secretory ATPase GspE/PulE/Tfp pilus assembly ATPase PilB-like protein